MRVTVKLGPLSIDARWGDEDNGTDPGDCTSERVGFVPTPGDQRWEEL